jgi:hypothetical protein
MRKKLLMRNFSFLASLSEAVAVQPHGPKHSWKPQNGVSNKNPVLLPLLESLLLHPPALNVSKNGKNQIIFVA